MKQNIFDLSFEALSDSVVEKFGEKSFRANQIWNWLYKANVSSFDEMSNLPQNLRNLLKNSFSFFKLSVNKEAISLDGTVKWLLKLEDGNNIEMVLIPEDKRNTLCISSQVGCSLNCKFCHTGTQKIKRNLSKGEIVGQVLFAISYLKKNNYVESLPSNIVFMGMGEPLMNYQNLKDAINIITSSNGIGISSKRVVVSTSGIVPQIIEMANDLKVRLAISLHAANEDVRTSIMPINKKYSLKSLIDACKEYYYKTKSGIITFEYVMLDGVNDTKADVDALISIMKNVPSKLNLIPFNIWDGVQYKPSSYEKIKKFATLIDNAGFIVTIRKTRGHDIMAACGQLNSAYNNSVVNDTQEKGYIVNNINKKNNTPNVNDT